MDLDCIGDSCWQDSVAFGFVTANVRQSISTFLNFANAGYPLLYSSTRYARPFQNHLAFTNIAHPPAWSGFLLPSPLDRHPHPSSKRIRLAQCWFRHPLDVLSCDRLCKRSLLPLLSQVCVFCPLHRHDREHQLWLECSVDLMKLVWIIQRLNKNLPVIICRYWIRNPCRVGICVDDANGRDVVESAFVKQNIVLYRIETDD